MSPIGSGRLGKSWSPEKDLWQQVLDLGGDLQWKRVRFDINREVLIPLQSTGVYLICVHPPRNAFKEIKPCTIIYAGQVKSATRGIRTRFLDHINNPQPRLKPFLDCFYPKVDFWFAITLGSERIDTLETVLIDAFNPPCNAKSAPHAQKVRARLGIPKQFTRSMD